MSAFHQMGHDSENLLREPELSSFRGAILSPVNYNEAKVASQVAKLRESPGMESWFDPQLYVPTSARGKLRSWSYFPTDVDTADQSSEGWWVAIVNALADCCVRLNVTAVCSPAVLSRQYSDEYFGTIVGAGQQLVKRLAGTGMRPVQTAVVGMNDLAVEHRLMSIASILSRTEVPDIYLVLIGTTEPRRELTDVEEIKGSMKLIQLLSGAGYQVTVGYASSDMLLWKHAGATNCATGKFFNLRRFSRSRFDEPSSGGGQLPYWFEEKLLAFLREGDLVRVQRAGLLSESTTRNPFATRILSQMAAAPGNAWLGASWREYLWWFAEAEARVSAAGAAIVPEMLSSAEAAWQQIETSILMEERANDGNWIRQWRRACLEL
ncbi:hypothetical protein [Gemmatimonas sp.]|uniref:hypothetical protein n=1 Tax=Gemmatimonas sp. TaxID=1962908 RepID=UPI00286DBB6E|nr:hypothetical protein [Gemmatimonas sp.]